MPIRYNVLNQQDGEEYPRRAEDTRTAANPFREDHLWTLRRPLDQTRSRGDLPQAEARPRRHAGTIVRWSRSSDTFMFMEKSHLVYVITAHPESARIGIAIRSGIAAESWPVSAFPFQEVQVTKLRIYKFSRAFSSSLLELKLVTRSELGMWCSHYRHRTYWLDLCPRPRRDS